MRTYCIVLASGKGMRCDGEVPKQFVRIGGKMILEHTIAACDCDVFDEIVLVVSADHVREMEALVSGRCRAPIRVVAGGASRFESCAHGLAAIGDDDGRVIIHNGVQPFVTKAGFEACLNVLTRYPVALSAIPCTYTILQSVDGRTVDAVPDRRKLYCDMGIEGFALSVLRRVVSVQGAQIGSANFAGIALALGIGPIGIFTGDASNVKITYAEDVAYAQVRMARDGECKCRN